MVKRFNFGPPADLIKLNDVLDLECKFLLTFSKPIATLLGMMRLVITYLSLGKSKQIKLLDAVL